MTASRDQTARPQESIIPAPPGWYIAKVYFCESSKRHGLERIPIIAWVIEHEVISREHNIENYLRVTDSEPPEDHPVRDRVSYHPRPMTMYGAQPDLNDVGVEWMFVLPDGRFASDDGSFPSVASDDHIIDVMLKRRGVSRRSSPLPAWPEAPKGILQ